MKADQYILYSFLVLTFTGLGGLAILAWRIAILSDRRIRYKFPMNIFARRYLSIIPPQLNTDTEDKKIHSLLKTYKIIYKALIMLLIIFISYATIRITLYY